jgi:oligopeptide transport system permease protein
MNPLFEPLDLNEEPVFEIPDKTKSLLTNLFANKSFFWGFLLFSLLFLFAVFGPLISPYTYYETLLSQKNLAPSLTHWFGTDDLGRDLFTRVAYGARISLTIGIAAAFIDVLIGVLWGSLASYAGGKVEELMMRFADLLYSLPYLLIVILLSLVLGSGFFSILCAMTILGWITMARIVRGQIAYLKKQDYVLASKALGASFPHILFKHLIPNCLGSIIVTLTTTIPSAIFVEAFLSFLGLGIQAPISSWGSMAHDGLPALSYYPWRLFFPAAAISLTMLAFNLMGDGLSRVVDRRENII